MARIRSIHPGLTSDESYMSMSMTAKAAWSPLWMQCDDHGIFEWKPIVLKALIFPADNVDFDAVLGELEKLGCVWQIVIEGKRYGLVRNFARYQRPKNPSYRHFSVTSLPPEYGSYIGLKGAAPPALPQPSPSATEIPPQRKEEGGKRKEIKKESLSSALRTKGEDFEKFKKVYPRRKGNFAWKAAEKKFTVLLKTGVDPNNILQAASRFAAEARDKIGTEFIPQAAKWLNAEDFSECPPAASETSSMSPEDAVKQFARFGIWSRWAGPEPGQIGCRASDDLLERYGLMPDGRKIQATA